MSSPASDRSGVEDLGPDALLAALRDNERTRRETDLDQLRLAYQWCILHPATPDTGTAVWGGDGHLDATESLGGDGTPAVAAFAPEPLGLALGIPTSTAMTLMADASTWCTGSRRPGAAPRRWMCRSGGPAGSPNAPTP